MPAVGITPYDSVDTILNFARVIANDCSISLAGNLLADTQPYTFALMNLAWRKLQDRLANNSIESFPEEVILTNIGAMPASAQVDPGTQAFISFTGYFDGLVMNPLPILPTDMEIPLKLWERASGQNANFIPMYPVREGLPSRGKSTFFREWEWREDSIYLVGATQKNDIRIRYRRVIADVASSGVAQIPLIRCAVAMAYLVVETFAESRGSMVSPLFTIQKETAILQLINNTTRKKQRGNYRRIPYSRRRY